MAYKFLDIAATPSVRAAQAANGSGAFWANFKGGRALTDLPNSKHGSSPSATAFTWRLFPKAAGPMCSIAAGR